MVKIVMYPHNGSGNHGCEAIIRSTYSLLKDNAEMILFSEHPEEDIWYMPDVPVKGLLARREIFRFSIPYFKAMYYRLVRKDAEAFSRETFAPFINSCRNGIYLSVGGDLYCYNKPYYLYKAHQYAKQAKAKSVLWCCSVDPQDIDEDMKKDLASYDLICARESISYEALKQINHNTILTVDPAFILSVQSTALPGENYVGINLSPMITEREAEPGITLENYENLIRHILKKTNSLVALIPHVVWRVTDDRSKLAELKKRYAKDDRVIVIDDMNCLKLKYIIGHCRMFIGARTHATIAAYSSCVPTLTVGYSVKAKGIAKDLFGTYENYVVPVQSLKSPDDLTNAFIWMAEREEEIRAHLQRIMPEYKNRIYKAVEAVKRLEQSI